MKNKDEIKKLISDAKIREAINVLLEVVDSKCYDEVIGQSSRFSKLEKEILESTITRQDEVIEHNKIVKVLLEIIEKCNDGLDSKEKISLEDLRKLKESQLQYFLEQEGIRATIQLLKKLLDSSSEKLAELKRIESEIVKNDSKYSFAVSGSQEKNPRTKFENWNQTKEYLHNRISVIISEVGVNDITSSNNWEKIYLETLALGQFDGGKNYMTDVYGLFTPADEIIPPDELKEEKKDIFKRLLHRAQDALAVKDYSTAYRCCEKIRDNIEPKSAQLYEYMLLIFAKKEGVEKIIKEALEYKEEKEDSLVRHLILYSGRYYQFERDKPSPTGEDNIQEVINSLSRSLKNEYSEITGDYLFSEGKINDIELNGRLKIIRTIEVTFNLRYAIPKAPPMSFLNIIYNELSGGGKFDWLEITDYDESGWLLQDKRLGNEKLHINALTLISEIRIILRDSYKEKSIDILSILSQNLLMSLISRYDEIKKQALEKPFTTSAEKYKLSGMLIKLIKAFQVGFEISGKSKEYLDIPIQELEGGGIFKWAIFDDNGTLRENEICSKFYNFRAMEELARMIKLKEGEVAWGVIRSKVREETYQRLKSETDEAYRKIVQVSRVKELDQDDRKIVQDCLNQWETLYFIKFEEDILRRYLDEIVGDGIFLWIDVCEEGIISNKEATELFFNVSAKINRLFNRLNVTVVNSIKVKIVKNVFYKSILIRYESIAKKDEVERRSILNLMERAISLYKFIFPDGSLLDFVYKELIQENKLQWFDVQNDKIIPFENNLNYDIQLTQLYEEFARLIVGYNKMGNKNLVYDIIEKRFDTVKHAYEREIREFKSQNGVREMEITIQLIRRCYSFFRVYPHDKFIEIPRKELIERVGRIKWSYQFGKIEFPTFTTWVSGIYEVYKKEKHFLETLLAQIKYSNREDILDLLELNKPIQLTEHLREVKNIRSLR